MRARILTLLVGSSLAVAMLVAAPAARADTSWSDARANANVSDLPFSSSTVDLNGATAENDPTDCSDAMVRSVWTTIDVPADGPLFMYAPTFAWSGNVVLAIYPHGTSTATFCLTGENQLTVQSTNLTAGTYDVLVGSTHPELYYIELSMELLTVPTNDDWAAPAPVEVGGYELYDLRASSVQADEPLTPCMPQATRTQWYSFTAPSYGWIDVTDNGGMSTAFGLFTSPPGGGTPVYAGQCASNGGGTLVATPGTHYLLQISSDVPVNGSLSVRQSEPPYVYLNVAPYDPSTFDTVAFALSAWTGATQCTISFGDGTPAETSYDCLMGWSFQHRYAKDGTYSVTGSIVAPDGRTGERSVDVIVATHDVAVTSLTAPKTATVGRAKQVSLNVATLTKNSELATVSLYASTPDGGWVVVGTTSTTLTPSKKTVPLSFTWIPAAADVGAGVVLKAVVQLTSSDPWNYTARDARPENDQRTSAPIKVSR